MVSVLIPVYNFYVVPLVENLLLQIRAVDKQAEILVFDDGSDKEWKLKNRVLQSKSIVRYHELESNLGRSAIRNRLAEIARYELLIFLDCDVMPESDGFIKRYVDNIKMAPLLCGGLSYDPEPPTENSLFLHWLYGQKREVRSLTHRQREPYRKFLTSNFLIKKSVFQSVKFDETITGYGHEDTLFGLECLKNQVNVFHLENPVRHLGLDPFEVFLKKRFAAISDLNKLKAQVDYPTLLEKHIRILAMANKLKKYRVNVMIMRVLKAMEPRLMVNLKGSNPNLKYFDLLRLKHLLSS